MAYPHNCKNNARNPNFLSCHHEKSKSHEQRYCRHDRQFCFQQHSLFLHEGLQMLFVQISSDKPVVKLLRTLREAEHCCQIKRNCWKYRQKYADCSQCKTDAAENQKNQSFNRHCSSPTFSFHLSSKSHDVSLPRDDETASSDR